MVKVKHKTAFKKSLRDAQKPEPKNPYVPLVPQQEQIFRRAEDACKELAATDVELRDEALKAVHDMLRWLGSGEAAHIDIPVEFAKLWKGLFYCMWHSDKPLVQLACAERISDLMAVLPQWELRAEWQKQAWVCMSREWSLIDKWRVDKFYSLMRFIFNRGLVAFQEAKGTDDKLFFQPLLDLYSHRTAGVASHVTDIFIEECVKVKLSMECFHSLLFEFVFPHLCSGSADHNEHIYDYIWTKMLGGYKEDEETIDYLADIEWDVVLEKLQEAAIDEATVDKNRALLTRMAEELEAFLEQAEAAQDLVEVDSDEEAMDVRREMRRKLELERREKMPSEAKKSKAIKEKRVVERKVKQALASGDSKAAADLVKKARLRGVNVPKTKKKKKGKLADALTGDPRKKVKTRHKKRRV
ncbi:Ribosomal RNA-processing protein 1-like protein [Diplonema papillatum]|nr:Ribosomal RNA-processing protein 1-like protein [Diplonema papillatum]